MDMGCGQLIVDGKIKVKFRDSFFMALTFI
jgi:hypothetical protein